MKGTIVGITVSTPRADFVVIVAGLGGMGSAGVGSRLGHWRWAQQRFERATPGPATRGGGDQRMRRRGEHAGHLHGQYPAGREHGEQRREEPVVITQTMKGSVGIDEIDRPRRLPGCEVGALPVDPRRLGGLREHGFGFVYSRDVSVWPARAEVAGDVARSRAQVVDLGRICEIDPIQEVDGGLQALVAEL